MLNIIFLVGTYLPNPSPNGRIADVIVNELTEFCKITVVAAKSEYGQTTFEESDNVCIIRIADHSACLHTLITERIRESSGVTSIFWKYVLFCKRALFKVPRYFRCHSYSYLLTRKYQRATDRIIHHEDIDALIPVSAPHEAMAAALKIIKKHPEINLIPYQLDRFANAICLYDNPITKKIIMKNNISFEYELISASKHYFLLFPIYSHFNDDPLFFDVIEKMTPTEHPLVRKIRQVDDKYRFRNTDKIHMVYAGSLDKTLRNPEYLLKMFFIHQAELSEVALELFTFGNCQEMIQTYVKILPELIHDNGKVSAQILESVLYNADLILTIGNRSDKEVPSKLFEYLSYGKPIVHLYYSTSDAYIYYLERYPYALLLNMEDKSMEKNALKLATFIHDVAGKTVKSDAVISLYKECTSNYVSQMFQKELME